MGAKKIYTLQINGISKNITETRTLREELDSLNASIGKANQATAASTQTTRQSSKALTEEEKAAKKLEQTKRKLELVDSDANKKQIAATQSLREKNREVTREIQFNQQSEGSIKQIGMRLTDLRNRYENLSRAKREDINVGGEMLLQIQALDKEYKSLRESTGNFRDSVGNYEKATSGIEKLGESINNVSQTSLGFAQNLLMTNQLMFMFGDNSETNAKQAKALQKVMLALTVVQGLSNTLLKENNGVSIASIALDKIRATNIKIKTAAEAASTRATVAATVAQRVFNIAAAANPYILLALALVAVGTALFTFASNTDNAAEKQKRLNDQQQNYLDALDAETNKTRDVSKERISNLERQLKVLEAQGNKKKEIRKIEDQIASVRRRNNAYLRGFHAQEIKDLDENKEKLNEYKKILQEIKDMQTRGVEKVSLGVNLDGNMEKYDIQKALDITQTKVDEYGRKVQIAVDLNTEQSDLDTDEQAEAERRKKQDAERAKKAAETELSVVRTTEDTRIKLIENSNERQRKVIEVTYDRQIEDIRRRLESEEGLTTKAKEALKETIINLEKRKNLDLNNLDKEQANKSLAIQKELESSRIALIEGNADRQTAEINMQYDTQIAAYKKRLTEDKDLTEEQQAQITELILNAQKARGNALTQITNEQLSKQANLQLTAVEGTLEQTQQKIEEGTEKIGLKIDGIFVRNKKGLQLIDVEATRANLVASNKALDEYMEGLKKAQKALNTSHTETLKTLKKGTPEYEAELQKYAAANAELNTKLANANKQRGANIKASNEVITDYYKDLFGKVAKYAQEASIAVSAVTDTFSMGLQMQIDNLNEQLDIITEKYEEVKELREKSTERVEELEQRLQDATGGTAQALKEQLQDEMHNRAELEREEARLQKEKEKREAEIAKKEKQQKRANLVSDIANAVATTASAVVGALGNKPWGPWNIALAALVGTMGAVQVGIMSKQLTKLEDGGLINGPSHANGGARIQGTNIEVEGGEYVVNKESTAANSRLIEFINNTRSTVTAADLVGLVPSDTNTPIIINNQTDGLDYKALAEAMTNIHIEPKVAVTDIMDAQDTVVDVRDLAGF